jgi:hypothetical protein
VRPLSFRNRLQILLRGRLAVVHETESSIAIGRGFMNDIRDRQDYDRAEVLEDSFNAWRLNPLARRIVELTTQYVVGGGITTVCKHEATLKFIKDFWGHRLNRMEMRAYELCDELTRSGNIFVLVSTDASGMSYIRAVPAFDVDQIEARANDVEQPEAFHLKAGTPEGDDGLQPKVYQAYDEETDSPDESGSFPPVLLHYTINRPVGGQWGESDLAPILKWLARYSAWLEDRARLNRFRNSFMFVVKSVFASEAERAARQATLAANPPQPGSILVCDESESWEVISPKLEAGEANTDGLALKKMVASGVGIPMHFLAEPEGSTHTTAEAAGGPSFRHFEQRQRLFLWILHDLLSVVISRRALVDRHVSRRAEVEVRGADISARDNVSLGMAASNIQAVLSDLRDRGMIDNAEYLRMVYRFCGEYVDVPEMMARAKAEGPQTINILRPQSIPSDAPAGTATPAGSQRPDTNAKKVNPAGRASDIDPETGELKESVENPG